MYKITQHPILDVSVGETSQFSYNGRKIMAEKGKTIAAALHQAGFPVHSHSLTNRNRSLECGIGKCGACEMLVDGFIKRICITKVDNIKEVTEIPKNYEPTTTNYKKNNTTKIYKTTVAIIGAGPAGLAARAQLNEHNIDNLVIDNNDTIGGQFTMQTHQFFFFENEKKFGGMRGFDIPPALTQDNRNGILLNSTVWDLLEGKRIAVKNITTDEIYYVDADHLIIATGAVPFMPSFENDDLPGVYTAAVVQKMMNNENTLLGKNILTVGAGNIGYLTSYQAVQAGAEVKAILEAQPNEGGFPVQANRVRRLGIPIYLSHILVKAIPNADHTGITGAVVAEAKNFKPVPGTERIIEGIDTINICTGLVPDDALLRKGKEVFGRNVHGAGDAIRIGEGTSAVLRGKQVAFEILDELGERFNYDEFLKVSKEYIDSQQHPVQVIPSPALPDAKRMEKPFVIADCLYGFACNPCAFACPHDAITKSSSSTVPVIDFDKCIGCMQCVTLCPGLAIFGYNLKKSQLFFPVEYEVTEGEEVFLVNNNGDKLGSGILEKVIKKPNNTNLARVKATDIEGHELIEASGFIAKSAYPETVDFAPSDNNIESKEFICHCDDVTMEEVMKVIGDRKFISVDEIKHTTRLGMGACRGKRCIKRLKTALAGSGIQIIGEATPRGPMSNQVNMGELYPNENHEKVIPTIKSEGIKTIETGVLVAGGGIGGSALFRYFAEAGEKPILINHERGSSWRNIAGGRPVFSVPELADIAQNNRRIFQDLQNKAEIHMTDINYITLAHDQATYEALEASKAWSDAFMIEPKEFPKYIAPGFSTSNAKYMAAMVTKDCWQATPGLVIDLIRKIGIEHGGTIHEDARLIDIEKTGEYYIALVKKHDGTYVKYKANHFVNALGGNAGDFATKLGIETGLFPVKHQAFITRRLPNLGVNNQPLNMVIDRRKYKGFTAVYGQQLAETGQIIGCASPAIEPLQTDKNLKINDKDFLEIVSEVFVDWLPELSSVGFQAVWSGYYVEPRMIIDPAKGLFIGLRGQGFMLGMYLAKLYVDAITGQKTPDYLSRLNLEGDGLQEKAFK
ncbi:MAG: FAD-dependent oxidoreductase [Salinivirgaceae bacterium]|jgi:glycine/D-amino acid oxidase-like deaminating enzyme/NADPH-dependent 2,4-dienoyl-CoA reductase/sulfur reductase-like enzyme/Fe-S-cluster-containing hydrogenase component 2|nr:FAD-dependent oxidoreductase [Salinivirgaceae bacterium]